MHRRSWKRGESAVAEELGGLFSGFPPLGTSRNFLRNVLSSGELQDTCKNLPQGESRGMTIMAQINTSVMKCNL